VDYLSTGHIEMPQDKIIPTRVKVVLNILEGVDSLLVVFKGPQMELLLCVHDFYLAVLVSSCEDCPIRA
jgi:hypothetical protein